MLAVIAIMTLVAAGIDVWGMIWATRNIQLADLFLLFIYTEIVGKIVNMKEFAEKKILANF